jgi:hypothetical protein
MILVGGGIAFFLKLVAIPTTGGEDSESGAIALLYLAGMFGMLVGSTALGSRLAEHAPLAVYVIALVLSPVVIWVVFIALDGGLKPIGEAGPDWYVDEAGITASAVLMVGTGLWLLRREPHISDEARSGLPSNPV